VEWSRKLSQVVVGVLVVMTLVLPQIVYAGTLTAASLSMSDPRPTTSSTHTIKWTEATDATLKCVIYKYRDTPISATVPSGLVSTTATKGTFVGITTANWTLDASVNGTLKLTYATGEQPGGSSALTAVTTPFDTITNPVAGTFFVQINTYTNTDCATGPVDNVVVASVATAGTLISATINPTLTFTVAGLGNGATIKGAVTTENGGGNLNCATSTATAISFPTNMSVNTNYTCGQSLTTSTNAPSGYSVSLRGTHASGDFLKGTPTTLTITDGSGSNASPAAFGTPSENFSYTSSDAALSSGTTTRFSADDTWAKVGNNSATNEEVAYDSVPVNAQQINIGYRIRFSGTTEANTYTGTVLYTCTATF
jgi:hypothetical protein